MLRLIIVAVFCWRRVTLIEHPKNAVVPHGTNHTLNCRFNESVQCSWWLKGNIPVIIDGRYRYIANNTTSGNEDCSIEITSFQDIDANIWFCKGTNNGTIEESNEAKLHAVVPPIILLNGISISNLSVFSNGSQTGNLTCMVEDLSTSNIAWKVDYTPVMSNVSSECKPKEYCNSTLSWIGDWLSLVNATNVSCASQYAAAVVSITTKYLPKEDVFKGPTNVIGMSIINIALITGGAVVFLFIAIFCLLACSFAKHGTYKTSFDMTEFIPSVKYFSSTSNISVNSSAKKFNSCSQHTLPDISVADGGYFGSEKLEDDIIIKPEYGSALGGAIMIHYSNSERCKREPIDSLYVNRFSDCSTPRKAQSLGCRAIRPRMPLPFGSSVPSFHPTGRIVSGPYSMVRDNFPKPNPQEPHLYHIPPP